MMLAPTLAETVALYILSTCGLVVVASVTVVLVHIAIQAVKDIKDGK